MRQYRVLYKRLGSPSFSTLEAGVHAKLYSRQEVQDAIAHMRVTPCVGGMAIVLEDEMFNVVAFDQPAEAPRAFKFDPVIVEGEEVAKTNA